MAKKATKSKKNPVQETLPTMRQAKNARLDRCCAAIYEARLEKNDASQRERGAEQEAIVEMVAKGLSQYVRHRVRLTLSRTDKLGVRLLNAESESASDDTTTGGEGEDATLDNGGYDDLETAE